MDYQQKRKVVCTLRPCSQTDSATITRLVISWSFGFTQQSPTWWSPGPLCSHNNHLRGDLLVLYAHTTITCVVISWSFGFTQQSPTCLSPGPLASHNNHPPGDLLVLWVHTTVMHLLISSSFGFTQQSPAWSFGFTQQSLALSVGFIQQSHAWLSPGPSGSHNNHPPGNL